MSVHVNATTLLGPVRQTAFVVDDIEASALGWVDRHGIGPWFLYDVDIGGTDYRGSEQPLRARMGLAQSGGQQIELIQPAPEVAGIYTEHLQAAGPDFHHVCYWAPIDEAVEHFAAKGSPVVQRGVTGHGNSFVYVEGSCGVPFVEIVDPAGQMATFFEMVARAADLWDGSEPLR